MKAKKQDVPVRRVRIGERVYRVRSQIVIEEVEADDDDVDGQARPVPEGGFEMLCVVKTVKAEYLTNEKAIQAFLNAKAILRPQADADLCSACGTCVDQCPVQALSMPDDLPQVDPDICIACFCCQEICPEKAITLR